MVSQVTGINSNNLAFAKNAIKYLQDTPLTENSLGKDIKDSAKSGLIFGSIFQTCGIVATAIKNRKKDTKLIDALAQKYKSAAENVAKEPGKLAKFFKLDKLNNLINKTKIGKALGKIGFGSMFVFNALFQLGEIIPAFKNGGTKEGIKQVGRSTVTAAVDAVAYGSGIKLGSMLGAKIGGLIGTAGGPVGCAVGGILGGILGIVVGGIAGNLAGKFTKKICGKNYNEKAAENAETSQAQQIAQDPEAINELKQLVAQKFTAEQQSGKLSQDGIQLVQQMQCLDVSFGSATAKTQTAGANTLATGTANTFEVSTASNINQSFRNSVLNKQAEGIYQLNHLKADANGRFDRSIYKIPDSKVNTFQTTNSLNAVA